MSLRTIFPASERPETAPISLRTAAALRGLPANRSGRFPSLIADQERPVSLLLQSPVVVALLIIGILLLTSEVRLA